MWRGHLTCATKKMPDAPWGAAAKLPHWNSSKRRWLAVPHCKCLQHTDCRGTACRPPGWVELAPSGAGQALPLHVLRTACPWSYGKAADLKTGGPRYPATRYGTRGWFCSLSVPARPGMCRRRMRSRPATASSVTPAQKHSRRFHLKPLPGVTYGSTRMAVRNSPRSWTWLLSPSRMACWKIYQ